MVASPCPSQIENSKYASLKFTFVSLAPTLFANENNTVAINKAPTILHILCFIKLPPNKKSPLVKYARELYIYFLFFLLFSSYHIFIVYRKLTLCNIFFIFSIYSNFFKIIFKNHTPFYVSYFLPQA